MSPTKDSSYHSIDVTLLLRFLITRYAEMLRSDKQGLDPVWAGLGLVALYRNRELAHAFELLISSDSYTVQERLTSSIDLFLAELVRQEAADPSDQPEKEVQRRPLSRGAARSLRFWSWREGRKMMEEHNFEFYPCWALIAWLALETDEEIGEFDEKCRFSVFPVEEKLRQGLDLVKNAIFSTTRRRNVSSEKN